LKTKNAIFIWVGVAVLLIATALLVLYSVNSANNRIAKMGKYDLKVADYKYYLYSYVNQIESTYSLTTATTAEKTTFWTQKLEDGTSYADFYKDNALNQLKKVTISALKAKEAGYTVPQETKDQYAASFKDLVDTQFGGNRVDADKAAVAELGVTIDQFTQILYQQYLAAKYDDKYFTDGLARVLPTITADDAKVSFDATPTSYNTFTVSHILFLTVDSTTGAALDSTKINDAYTLANEVLAKVTAGEDFAALALQYSQDDGTKGTGGVLTFNRLSTSIDPTLTEWAAAAAIGKVEVIQSNSGFHVIRMDKNEPTAFETITEDIRKEIATNKVNEEMAAFLDDVKYTVKKNTAIFSKITVIR
jgi:foldase protein PrsA